MKFTRQCTFALLVKVDETEGKALESGEGTAMISGARREVEQGLTAFDRDIEF
jgi:hypothetical protein